MIRKKYYSSPIGKLEVCGNDEFITSIKFVEFEDEEKKPTTIIEECIYQLQDYFLNRRKTFDIPFTQNGTNFQQDVWHKMTNISYGKTISYRKLAEQISRPNTYRAVGMACKVNSIPIIVPCHRVVGSNGKLTGYTGGIWRKKWLLKHEMLKKL